MDQRAEHGSKPTWRNHPGPHPWPAAGELPVDPQLSTVTAVEAPPAIPNPMEALQPADEDPSIEEWIAENLVVTYPPETFYRALQLQLHRCNEFEQLSQSL